MAEDVPERGIEATAAGGTGAFLMAGSAAEVFVDGFDFEGGAADDDFGVGLEEVFGGGTVAPANNAGVGADFDKGGGAGGCPVKGPAGAFAEGSGEFVDVDACDADDTRYRIVSGGGEEVDNRVLVEPGIWSTGMHGPDTSIRSR